MSWESIDGIIWVALAGSGSGILTAVILILLLRMKNAKKTHQNQFQTSFVFSGNLKQTTLLDAIQFLEIGRREGILHVYSGRRKGYLTFLKGQVVDAFVQGHNPTVQQVSGAGQLPAEIVDEQHAAIGLQLERRFVEAGVLIVNQVEGFQSQFAANDDVGTMDAHPALIGRAR